MYWQYDRVPIFRRHRRRPAISDHDISADCFGEDRAVVAPSRRACGSKRSLLQYSPRLKGYLHLTHVPSVGI
ncbi:hypothetical protein V490_00015 [Pseudogymnoascus sp. VKM F-3557]|nr:hypothetical protein V490_00015 [Pseudogymnoascus sp. VKM F-3557]